MARPHLGACGYADRNFRTYCWLERGACALQASKSFFKILTNSHQMTIKNALFPKVSPFVIYPFTSFIVFGSILVTEPVLWRYIPLGGQYTSCNIVRPAP